MKLDDYQKKFLETKGDKILCTGRQVGKSTVCAKDAVDWAMQHPNTNTLMIAPTERQAYGLFSKSMAYAINNFPNDIKEGKDKPTRERFVLSNGAEIYCLPVGIEGLSIRFMTVHRLYIDEASRVPEAVFDAVTPALLTTGGDTIMLSTPFGKRGTFYKCWINEDHAFDSFTRFSVSSEEVMNNREINEDWTIEIRDKALKKLVQEKKRKSARIYAQEYLGEFVDALFRLFSDELIKKQAILKRPLTIEGKNFMGCDIARLGGDSITYEILQKVSQNEFRQVENIFVSRKELTETHKRILELTDQWNLRQIGIDAGSGSLGVALLDFLRTEPKTMNKIVALTNQRRLTDADGKKSTTLFKEDMYMNMLNMLERGELFLLDDQSVIDSLRSVNYEYEEETAEEVTKETRIKIYGNYTHIAEGLVRAAWLAKQDKSLNLFATSSNHEGSIF
mgnify:CR=1 FL=1